MFNGSGNLKQSVNLGVGGTVTYQLSATIAPGATGTLTATAAAAVPAGASDPNPANNTATDTDTLTPRADLSITKTDGQTSAVPGTPVTYTLTVSNAGPSSVTGAQVQDAFPAGLTGITWTCAAGAGATCAASGKGKLDTTADLPAGTSATYTLSATIDPAATGTLANTATTSAPAGVADPEAGNNSATDTNTLTPEADLAITKTDGQSAAVPGTPVTYTLQVSNAGPSSVTGARVRDTFPAALTGVTWTCTAGAGATCAASGGGNLDASANVPAGSQVTYTVTATLDPAATGTLTNTATVAAPTGVLDRNAGNDSASDTDTLTPRTDLAVTKTDGATEVTAGQALTYTVAVTNHGPSKARGATVSDTLPAALQAATWTCTASPGGTCAASGTGNIQDSIDLAPGATATYTLKATLDLLTTSATLVNNASVSPAVSGQDPVAGNNSATDANAVIRQADLMITKTANPKVSVPGSNALFTLVVSNRGPGDALGAVVDDVFPPQLLNITWSCTASTGANCPRFGRGDIHASVNLPAGAELTFKAEVQLSQDFTGALTNTATVTSPTGVPDADLTNNQATAVVLSTRVFRDGFESGDTSTWTATFPAPRPTP